MVGWSAATDENFERAACFEAALWANPEQYVFSMREYAMRVAINAARIMVVQSVGVDGERRS